MRQTRLRKRYAPSTPWSLHSRSRSTGAAKRMKRRAVSAPYFAMISSGETTLPFDFDIFEPSLRTMPCVSRFVNGSSKSTRPASCSTFVKKREYRRCRMACSMPPIYWSTGAQ
jgi:hypothetical protein